MPAAFQIASLRTDEEAEKRLGSALIAGDSIISIDNIDRPFGGELFCQALTQRMLKIRILGYSKIVEVPSNAALFANGNNLTLVGDMTRRAIMCTMDPGVERPETRVFTRAIGQNGDPTPPPPHKDRYSIMPHLKFFLARL
jgi:putative DNA primase/helicase